MTKGPETVSLRDEIIEIVRQAIEHAQDSAIPEPWEVAAHHSERAADSILSLLPPKGWRPIESANPGGDYKPEFFGHEWIGEYLAQDIRDTAQSLRQQADFLDGKADLLQEQMTLAAPVTKTVGGGNG